ncbi:MAG TPA: FtsW/RodA/SpoVE family cell cycle protein [Anaerolineales bacterium]|nr:FtsW/RodA/SpoVE family cell cycle protein [Anaerolineales bacterium]HMX74743.1 FtsW/RodA/SpoVE family cell cycle protein [Anaerolineales bacterium]
MHDQIQTRLLRWAGIFLLIQSTILTLAPAVRERSWDVDYRLSHWVGLIAWAVFMTAAHRASIKHLPERDPYLLPAAALLSGWGLLTIWRLDETFGIRQTIWLGLSVTGFILAMSLPQNLFFLRRYKYVLLGGGLLITALTLLLGTNPLGVGPRLWLGCCGVYFQPSEPLKLLLVIYLSAYLADRINIRSSSLSLLVPTLVVTGVALLLLLVQRDLGTASIFICIFTVIIFLSTGRRRLLFGAVFFLALALFLGYFFIDIIRIRVEGWLDPWADPSGQSYQIVQSLLAVANGGTIGRGPGLGSPLLVPVAISDFIYAAIAEETGLAGTIGLLGTIWLLLARGMISSLRAADRFRRYLAAGVVTYLGIQSLLIIGGNLRLVPLTGVTLPFVSYGGSSLLTSFIALFILLTISNLEDSEPTQLQDPKPYTFLAGLLALGLATSALTTAWWAVIRAPDLLNRTDNPRRAIADRYVPRGELVDRDNQPINITEGESGTYQRVYVYTELAPITGYTHPIYGQAGLEATLDDYLRGLQGNPASLLWWDRLVYGTPPPGLDVRLSLSLALQSKADQLLGGHSGAILLMNAETGEILAMASHPTYDPNKLDEEGEALSQATNSAAPLVNRATQGLYPIGTAMLPLIRANFGETQPTDNELKAYYQKLGLYQAPQINMPVAYDTENPSAYELRVSPLQISLAASVLSNHGMMVVPSIATAVNTPEQGWVVLSTAESRPVEMIQAGAADEAALSFILEGKPFWSHVGQASGSNDTVVTWFLGGTLPSWSGAPLTVVVTLEENNTFLAKYIGENLLDTATSR